MTDPALTLQTWLSPGFPIGAFAYSHGLETAIAEGAVADAAGAEAWIGGVLAQGGGRTDAILVAEAMRRPDDEEMAALATALAPSAERLTETEAQGATFAETVGAVWGGVAPVSAKAAPYPVAFGRAAARIGAAPRLAVALYLNAFAANLVSAAVRLVPLGQTEGQRIVAALHPRCEALADEAMDATLDDIGGCAILADIASMRHETQEVRLFRT